MAFIEARGVEFAYSPEEPLVIDGIDVKIEKGSYVAILGHNGCGKSTLAKLLCGIVAPTKGQILVDGINTCDGEQEFELRKKCGMVFQNPDNQLVATVVEEDVAFGPENLGVPRDEMIERVKNALEMVGMSEYAKHAPHKLSGGQKQRIAIAGIIAMLPKCIIFDESTAMLDPVGRRDVMEIMERINREEGITVINITHYMDEAARANRVIVINDGVMVLDGSPREVFSKVDDLHRMGLEAPQGVELVSALRDAGVKIGGCPLTEQECLDEIYKAISGV